MRKMLLFLVLFAFGPALLLAKQSPEQKRIGPILEKAVVKCNAECNKKNNKDACNKAIDELEESMRKVYKTAVKSKVNSKNADVQKMKTIMHSKCMDAGKVFLKKIDK